MTTIYHLEIGDSDFTPTEDQLKEIVAEFMKPIPAYGHKIKISEVFVDPFFSNERMVIQAGDKDWQPTKEELDDLVEKFKTATLIDQSVVATRKGVKLHMVPALRLPESGATE